MIVLWRFILHLFVLRISKRGQPCSEVERTAVCTQFHHISPITDDAFRKHTPSLSPRNCGTAASDTLLYLSFKQFFNQIN
jgi:hypothetical protein